jgi:uncharacterized protein
VLLLIPAVVGCIGGIYEIGGGPIIAPVLIGAGRPAAQVAQAALVSALVTSVAGVATFTLLSVQTRGAVAPNWPTGIALGVGGLLGSNVRARLQSRLPDLLIRRLLGVLEIAIAIRFLLGGLL